MAKSGTMWNGAGGYICIYIYMCVCANKYYKILYIMPLCHSCACTHVIQLSGIPAFVHPWINGMTEVVQFASVSSMSDILPTYICTLAHTHNFTQTG